MYQIFSKILLVALLLTACKTPVRKSVGQSGSSSLDGSIEITKRINEKEERAIKVLLDANPELIFEQSPQGFWYHLMGVDGDPALVPDTGDEVTLEYQVKSLKGELIYSSEEKGQKQFLVNKSKEIIGLHHGVQLMQQGQEAYFIFPSHRAYGFHGDDDKIGPNEPLIYKVKLLKIIKAENL